MTRAARAMAAAALAATAAGCGTPSSDLFIVERTGTLPEAKLTIRVRDGGTVRCDGGDDIPIESEDLLDARGIQEDLRPLLDENKTLPAGPQSLLQYRVMGEEGEVRFADNSADKPKVFGQLIQFTRKMATSACGKER